MYVRTFYDISNLDFYDIFKAFYIQITYIYVIVIQFRLKKTCLVRDLFRQSRGKCARGHVRMNVWASTSIETCVYLKP